MIEEGGAVAHTVHRLHKGKNIYTHTVHSLGYNLLYMINSSWLFSFILCIVALSVIKNKVEIVCPMCLHSLPWYIMFSLNDKTCKTDEKQSVDYSHWIWQLRNRDTTTTLLLDASSKCCCSENTHVTVDMRILSQVYTHTHTHIYRYTLFLSMNCKIFILAVL